MDKGESVKIREKIAAIVDWFKARLIVQEKSDELQHLLSSLRFFLNVLIIIGVTALIFSVLPDIVPAAWADITYRIYISLGILAFSSMHFFFMSRGKLKKLKEDYHFINSEDAGPIIVGNYQRSHALLKIILKQMFPLQLRDI